MPLCGRTHRAGLGLGRIGVCAHIRRSARRSGQRGARGVVLRHVHRRLAILRGGAGAARGRASAWSRNNRGGCAPERHGAAAARAARCGTHHAVFGVTLAPRSHSKCRYPRGRPLRLSTAACGQTARAQRSACSGGAAASAQRRRSSARARRPQKPRRSAAAKPPHAPEAAQRGGGAAPGVACAQGPAAAAPAARGRATAAPRFASASGRPRGGGGAGGARRHARTLSLALTSAPRSHSAAQLRRRRGLGGAAWRRRGAPRARRTACWPW
jgi:hypothetical protein